MNTETITTLLEAPREKAFAYLSDIKNLPKWAVEFCHTLEKENGLHVAVSDKGRAYVRFESDSRTGVIDMIAGPTKDQMMTWPTRVVGLPDSRSAFIFTALQPPGLDDTVFCGQIDSLRRELSVLAENLR